MRYGPNADMRPPTLEEFLILLAISIVAFGAVHLYEKFEKKRKEKRAKEEAKTDEPRE